MLENTPLIPKTKENWGEWITDKFGAFDTFLAMVPSGLLAYLLTDTAFKAYLKENNIILETAAISASAVMLVTAIVGKYRLVRFFNTETFKNLGKTQTWKDFFDCSKWTAAELFTFPLNTLASLPPSLIFTYLTKVSLDSISPLLKTYHTSATDFLSEEVLKTYIQAPFMFASFLANMLNFPGIHKGGVAFIQNCFDYLFTNPAYRNSKVEIFLAMQASLVEIKALYESGKSDEANSKLNALKNMDAESLRKCLLDHIPEGYKNKPESWAEFLSKNALALALAITVVWGFSSFYGLGAGAASFYTSVFPFLNLIGNDLFGKILGAGSYTSMLLLGISAANGLASTIKDWVFGRDMDLNVLSSPRNTWLIASTLIICLLGGAPNAYQDFMTSKNVNAVDIIMGFLAPMIAELVAVHTLNKQDNTNKTTSDNQGIKTFYEAYTQLCKAINIDNIAEEEFNKLYNTMQNKMENEQQEAAIQIENTAEAPSRYRSWVNRASNMFSDCKSTLFGNNNTPNNNIIINNEESRSEENPFCCGW